MDGAAPPRTLLGYARALDADVHTLAAVLPRAALTPLEYATRAHEILEDAARDLLSGADVPWSGEGVLATDAGLDATEEVITTLQPLLQRTRGRDDGSQRRTRGPARRRWPRSRPPTADACRATAQLTQRQSELLDGALGGALEGLSQVPGALETEAAAADPADPAARRSGSNREPARPAHVPDSLGRAARRRRRRWRRGARPRGGARRTAPAPTSTPSAREEWDVSQAQLASR